MIRLLLFLGIFTLSMQVLALNVSEEIQAQSMKKESNTLPKIERKKHKKTIRNIRKANQRHQQDPFSTLVLLGILLGIGIAVLGWIYAILALKILGISIILLSISIFYFVILVLSSGNIC